MKETPGYFWESSLIRLRATIKNDWENWRLESADSEAIRLMEWGIELPKNDSNVIEMSEKYDNFKDDYRKMFAIETHSNEFVGLTNLNSVDHKNGTFSFAIGIHKPYRQKGYALEAARLILRYGFYELRLQKCNSGCFQINEASIKLHKRLGFKEEGIRRRNIYTNGRYYDDLLLGLLREEFDEMEQEREEG